jgi:hypothetical protein
MSLNKFTGKPIVVRGNHLHVPNRGTHPLHAASLAPDDRRNGISKPAPRNFLSFGHVRLNPSKTRPVHPYPRLNFNMPILASNHNNCSVQRSDGGQAGRRPASYQRGHAWRCPGYGNENDDERTKSEVGMVYHPSPPLRSRAFLSNPPRAALRLPWAGMKLPSGQPSSIRPEQQMKEQRTHRTMPSFRLSPEAPTV